MSLRVERNFEEKEDDGGEDENGVPTCENGVV